MNLPASAGDAGLTPESGRSSAEGNGNPLQYSCLENPTDRGNWHAAVHRVAKSHTWLKQRSAHTRTQKGGMGEVGAGRLRGRIYMYTYSWFMLMYTRNQHNIVKQLSSNLKINFFKRLEVRNQVESHFLLLLRLLPLHREENAFPEAPWLTHCCNFHSWITWANLASKGCGKMNTWGGQTRGKWLGMALDRPPRRRLSFLKHLNGKWIWWNRWETVKSDMKSVLQ